MTVRKNEFDRALRNAYLIRSKYVHKLQPIQDQLKHPHTANGDVIRFSEEPYLSISGLVRVVQHVIRNFVNTSEKVTSETVNWRQELPGIMLMEMAPQYWIWQHEYLRQEHATMKLSGLLSQIEIVFSSASAITDIRELLVKYEKLIKQAGAPYKLQMVITYMLYNSLVANDSRCENYLLVFEENKDLLDQCTIETMIVWMLKNQAWPWSEDICAQCWNKYQETKYRKASINVPPIMSVAVMVEIASLFLCNSRISDYVEWMENAILEAAGQKELQTRLIEAKSQKLETKGMDVLTSSRAKTA